MPRSVYKQSAGNPIQLRMIPTEPLDIEFAYRRGVDNDDIAYTWKVLGQLFVFSLFAIIGCWIQFCLLDVSIVFVVILALLLNSAIAAAVTRMKSVRNFSLLAVLATWIYHFFPVSAWIEVYVALTANALIAREVVRHFVFISTVAPTSTKKAWEIREAACWQTAIASLPLVPLALATLFPVFAKTLFSISAIGWLLLAGFYGIEPKAYTTGLWESLQSWCSYNRQEQPLPGVLKSPFGCCRNRVTMLVVVVFLNAFVCFRLTVFVQLNEAVNRFIQLSESVDILEIFLNVAVIIMFVVGFAAIPLIILFLSIFVVGTPVLGKHSLPKPSFVPSDEWKEITDRIRTSDNTIERGSLYLGRVAYDQSPLLVPAEVFHEHAHFLGDSGSGKTARGLSPFIEQVIGTGNASVMVLDLKGDSPELLQTLHCGAKTAKSLSDTDVPVRYFTLRDDHATYGFNPFKLTCWSRLNDLQKTDILCGGLGLIYGTDYGEGYFSSANASVLYATVTHFPNIQSFEELSEKLAYVLARPKAHGLDDKSRDAGNHVKMSVARLASVPALNITETITPNAEVAQFCIDPSRLFEKPEAHYFSLSATLGPGSSPEIARLATYMLMTAATLSERKVPIYLIIDEFQRMASRNLDYLLQLARSMGVAVILANQSMQDLKRHDLIPTLETNCRYRQWFAISGWEDQDRLSQASGETVDTLEAISVTNSTRSQRSSSSTSHSSHQFIGPRLTKNDIKLVSDEDSKSIVLINRGAGYAQYGGMPVIIESDFHISPEEYQRRKSTPWPSSEVGTFVPAKWTRPVRAVPHRGRKKDAPPLVTHETIIGEQKPGVPVTPQGRAKSRRSKKSKATGSIPATSSASASSDLFERYLQDNPIESTNKASENSEDK